MVTKSQWDGEEKWLRNKEQRAGKEQVFNPFIPMIPSWEAWGLLIAIPVKIHPELGWHHVPAQLCMHRTAGNGSAGP